MFKRIFYALCTTCKPNKSRTVRYAFPITFIALAFVGAAAILSENTSYITIKSVPEVIKKGEVFFLEVYVFAHTPINAIDIEISYSQERMKVMGIDKGESVLTIWTEEPKAENGVISFRGGTFRKGFLDKHLIGKIRVEALESGTAKILTDSARFLAGDGKGTEVLVTETGAENTSVYITNTDGSVTRSFTGSAEVLLLTDIDGDGKVSLRDISVFMVSWKAKSNIYDFNDDGRTTFIDFGILLADSFFK